MIGWGWNLVGGLKIVKTNRGPKDYWFLEHECQGLWSREVRASELKSESKICFGFLGDVVIRWGWNWVKGLKIVETNGGPKEKWLREQQFLDLGSREVNYSELKSESEIGLGSLGDMVIEWNWTWSMDWKYLKQMGVQRRSDYFTKTNKSIKNIKNKVCRCVNLRQFCGYTQNNHYVSSFSCRPGKNAFHHFLMFKVDVE